MLTSSPDSRPYSIAEDEEPFDLDAVHRSHGNWLLRLLRRRFGSQEAEDIAQDVYARAAATRSQVHNPRGFLTTLATRVVRDRFRREAVRPKLVGEGQATADAATASEAAEALLQKQIVLALPPQLREVFLLRSFTPLTNAEIAERCGVSVKTVEERMTKALAICKVLLRD
ncbi:MAG: RNA polymerase sigma factor [Phenylobacterium sp.]